jgi:hydroxymethylpyrimidine/phosphomethylpyrimidine kinase
LRLLSIAGSDSSGRAGLQADLETFAAHGAQGLSVVTAVTAQGAAGVSAVHAVPPDVVAAQLEAALAEGVDAVKVGMLGTAAVVEVVARGLAGRGGLPVVVDPVLESSSGMSLLDLEGVARLRDRLLPLASLVTPNLPEASRLSGLAVASDDERLAAALHLAALGPAVLLKGGHGDGELLVDLLVAGEVVQRFAHARQPRVARGTGCRLASAVAARLGRGEPLPRAVGGAIEYLQVVIAATPVGPSR